MCPGARYAYFALILLHRINLIHGFEINHHCEFGPLCMDQESVNFYVNLCCSGNKPAADHVFYLCPPYRICSHCEKCPVQWSGHVPVSGQQWAGERAGGSQIVSSRYDTPFPPPPSPHHKTHIQTHSHTYLKLLQSRKRPEDPSNEGPLNWGQTQKSTNKNTTNEWFSDPCTLHSAFITKRQGFLPLYQTSQITVWFFL